MHEYSFCTNNYAWVYSTHNSARDDCSRAGQLAFSFAKLDNVNFGADETM